MEVSQKCASVDSGTERRQEIVTNTQIPVYVTKPLAHHVSHQFINLGPR